jgi:purine-binding chemotaxis protein CheW
MDDLYLQCLIAGRKVAIATHNIQSVIELGPITPVPQAPPHIMGLAALRSQALTVIDPVIALAIDSESANASVKQQPFNPDNPPRAVVIEVQGQAYAILVEDTSAVTKASSEMSDIELGYGAGWDIIGCGMIELEGEPNLVVDFDPILTQSLAGAS